MKRTIFITTILLFFMLLFTLTASCNSTSDKKDKTKNGSFGEVLHELQDISGKKWLENIFECDNGNSFCFPDEESVTTDRYYQFFVESIGLYEYHMFETEAGKIVAEKEYKNKWKNIYPWTGVISYPFGRGNGTGSGDYLEDVIITHQSDTKYTILIDYGGGIKALSKVTLVDKDNSFLIDYMESEYIE